ncbi:Hypothetical protein GLP15_2719 [Giardia lamblia P15]|uniref:Thioredoxin-like fold domain-containing protein n=1 Tax=Giardia intestinalis (strain P15) TaxID=658858 RepID=E1EZW5_GIAIA|nr:Hypothetical protein GLP15_2719 [Giardia lamblia P15]
MKITLPDATSADSLKTLPRLEDLVYIKRSGVYEGMGHPLVVIMFNSRSSFSQDSLRVIANAHELMPMVYFLAISIEHPTDLQDTVHQIPYLHRISVASDVQGCFATFMKRNGITLLPATMVFNHMQRLVWSGHAQSQNFVYALQRLRVSCNLSIPPILTNDVLQLPIFPVSERVTRPSWAFGNKGPGPVNSSRTSSEQLRHSVSGGDRALDSLPVLVDATRAQSTSQRAASRAVRSLNSQSLVQRSSSSFPIRHSGPADNLNKAFGEILIHSDRIYPALPYKPSFIPDNPMNDKMGMERLFSMSNRLLCKIK